MIHSTSASSLMSEDVTIRCRVLRRRTKPETSCNMKNDDEEAMEVTCTMRHWDKVTRTQQMQQHSLISSSRRSLASIAPLNSSSRNIDCCSNGPELVLTPIPELLPACVVRSRSNGNNHRAASSTSPIKQRSFRNGTPTKMHSAIILPLSDLMVSDVNMLRRVFEWTTCSQGLWRIDGLDQNAFDILLAFLEARMPPERMIYQGRAAVSEGALRGKSSVSCKKLSGTRMIQSPNQHGTTSNRPEYSFDDSYNDSSRNLRILQSTSSVASSSCFDVDALTAAHFRERTNQETVGEKVSRRVSHVLAAVSDYWTMSHTGLARLLEELDSKCCSGSGAATASASNSPVGRSAASPAQNHQAIRPFHYSDLELDDNDSALSVGIGDSVKV